MQRPDGRTTGFVLTEQDLEAIERQIDRDWQIYKEFKDAEQKLTKALEADPKNIRLLLLLAKLYAYSEEFDPGGNTQKPRMKESKRLYEKVLTLDPGNRRATLELADLFVEEPYNDWKRSEKLYLEVLERNPDDLTALVELGNLYSNQNRIEEAETYFRKTIEAYRRSNRQEIDLDAELAVRKAKEFLARSYLRKSEVEKARRLLLDSIAGLDELNEKYRFYYGCPYQVLGILYAGEGKESQAAAMYLKVAEAEPEQSWEQFNLEAKQRFQNALFPEGIAFDGENFGTAKINPVFQY